MSSDDPISSIQFLNASDERQRTPVSGLARDFLRIIGLLAPKPLAIPIAALDGAVDWVSKQRTQNRDELVDILAEESKEHWSKIENLLETSTKHRRFMVSVRAIAD